MRATVPLVGPSAARESASSARAMRVAMPAWPCAHSSLAASSCQPITSSRSACSLHQSHSAIFRDNADGKLCQRNHPPRC